MSPLLILLIGIAVVIGLIIVLRLNAFVALITAAMIVSVLAPGEPQDMIGRVASAFGGTAGGIGIVIAMAAIIGKAMMDSGAADRVVRFFLKLMGEKHGGTALMSSGFVLAVPVFFDTVFYLLVPLARSMHRRTGVRYLFYIMAISAGGAVTHTLVPPTPGPLAMAANLGFDIGTMILIGLIVAIPSAVVGLVYASWTDRRMPVPMRPLAGAPEPEPLPDDQLPSLFWSVMPVVLPVLLITANTVLTTIADAERVARMSVDDVKDWPAFRETLVQQSAADGENPGKLLVDALAVRDAEVRDWIDATGAVTDEQKAQATAALNEVLEDKHFYKEEPFVGVKIPGAARGMIGADRARMSVVTAERMNRLLLEAAYPELIEKHVWETPKREAADISSLYGNANLALLLAAAIAVLVYVAKRRPKKPQFIDMMESALMSAGVIILITAAGGAFGAMLHQAGVGGAVEDMFKEDGGGQIAGTMLLLLGFIISVVLKIAQGSSTVAMIVASAMIAAMVPDSLGFHPVYLATAIGSGSLVGSWMNDSGFWIFAKMGGLTELEALKSWTPMLAVLGITGMITTVVLALVLPLA